MITELAARKTAFWQAELKTRGGLEGWVRAEGKSLCICLSGPGAKNEDLKYLFSKGDEVVVRCQFPAAPKTYRRDMGDRWGVSLLYKDDFDPIPMYYDIEEPSTQKTVEFSFPADMITKRIAESPFPGRFKNEAWHFGRVEYLTRYIDGRRVRNDRLEDTWQHDIQAKATFFFKLP